MKYFCRSDLSYPWIFRIFSNFSVDAERHLPLEGPMKEIAIASNSWSNAREIKNKLINRFLNTFKFQRNMIVLVVFFLFMIRTDFQLIHNQRGKLSQRFYSIKFETVQKCIWLSAGNRTKICMTFLLTTPGKKNLPFSLCVFRSLNLRA